MELKKTKDYLLYSLGTRAPSQKPNLKSRSQSNKRKIKKIQAIEMSQEISNQKSFFITERDSQQVTNKFSLSKSGNHGKMGKANRSTSVNVSKILNQNHARSKIIEKKHAYHNKSEYGLKNTERSFLIKKRKGNMNRKKLSRLVCNSKTKSKGGRALTEGRTLREYQ